MSLPMPCLIALAALSKKRVAYLNMTAVEILLAYQLYVRGDPRLYWRQTLPVYVATAFAIVILFEHLNALVHEQDSATPSETCWVRR